MRYLFLLPLFLSAACQNGTTPPDAAPIEAPASFTTLSCQGLPGVGNIMTVWAPPTVEVEEAQGGDQGYGESYAAVYRDDAGIPGLQIKCRDYNQTVTFTLLGPGAAIFGNLSPIPPQEVGIYTNSSAGGWRLVKAASGTKADTTRINVVAN